ncbi:hypothetical protein KEM56_007821 [Ascosphaera pollenicola]|nr:hypothetical protein KEM56_007821 [Ascosphaera pollenicola]
MFKGRSIFALATALLATSAQCLQASYEEHISALAYGDVTPANASEGIVWLNITGFAPEKLPHVQNDQGIHTLDNFETLKDIAGLAQTAATNGQYGDLIFLHSAFQMNGYHEYLNTSSANMQEALLDAITDEASGEVDQSLADLYASTSSSKELADAFKTLKAANGDQLRKRWYKETCSKAHKAATNACRHLLNNVSVNATWKAGGPRNICKYGCCISWSANATFQVKNLTNAAQYCINLCGGGNVSCEIFGVNLQGTVVNQCLSNRANGCE